MDIPLVISGFTEFVKDRYLPVPKIKELVTVEFSKVRLVAVPETLFADSVIEEFTALPVNEKDVGLLTSMTKAGAVDPAANEAIGSSAGEMTSAAMSAITLFGATSLSLASKSSV